MSYEREPDSRRDSDPTETQEWMESLDAVIAHGGPERAQFLLEQLGNRSRERNIDIDPRTLGAAPVTTPYVNTIPRIAEPDYPGDLAIEKRIRAYSRWNAAAMVVRANSKSPGIGGHLASYASSATLYDVGFNHFFKGKDRASNGDGHGDFIYFQGHASPGIYARAYILGRLDDDHLDNFRQELGGHGVPSYPHPRSMPGFWEFPTVSMGIGPLNAIYQARFARYLHNRGITDTSQSRVWCFLGDGETDEVESLGALSVAAREGLDNLTFVVNCNLQRLDGPVRGNGKIIQELEGVFRGAGWNVIKVLWGSNWDPLLERDTNGLLEERLLGIVDGAMQRFAGETGAYIREHVFGPEPELTAIAADFTDDELAQLRRGGHDPKKVYAAYKAATEHTGAPTVILAHTIKGWALGSGVEAKNSTHQIKKLTQEQFRVLRDRLGLQDDISDDDLATGIPPYCRPKEGSPEHTYMWERRNSLGGPVPKRVVSHLPIPLPSNDAFAEFDKGSSGREVSTTMAFAVMLRSLMRDSNIGKHIVPIIPDEARTFGMDALFKEMKIYAPFGQKYEPVDSKLMLSYVEDTAGQILEEGITEAGSFASFTAVGTSHVNFQTPMIPMYVCYSMFGFQRVGDFIWAFGDSRGKGLFYGATAGRTTLHGEGLQHDDGHSLLLASAYPAVRAYDPAFAYETAAITKHAIASMFGDEQGEGMYYITLYNENYEMPTKPEDIDEGIIRGIYRFANAPAPEPQAETNTPATILFSGTAWRAATEAQALLAEHFGVGADLYSVTSYKSLREDALDAERWNRLHPTESPRTPYLTEVLNASNGPVIAISDFMRLVPDQVARWIPRPFTAMGADGYSRSDTREALRNYFEVDARHLVVAVLAQLVEMGERNASDVADAIARFGIDPEAPHSQHG